MRALRPFPGSFQILQKIVPYAPASELEGVMIQNDPLIADIGNSDPGCGKGEDNEYDH